MQSDAESEGRHSTRQTLLDAVDDTELNELLSRLVRARSDGSAGESEAATIVAEWCQKLGGEVSLTEPVSGRPNVVARFPGIGTAPSLAFSGHMDVVPVKVAERERWEQEPYGGKTLEGELWGRGSVDMKGGLASAMSAIAALRRTRIELPGDVWLLASMDEEIGMTGVKAMIQGGDVANVDAAIVCEPTRLRMNCVSKGRTWATLRVLGEPAHASFKDEGVNAISNALRLAAKLEETTPTHQVHDIAGESWWAITEIEGGLGPAVIPDRCDLTLDVRLVPGQTSDAAWQEVNEVIEQLTSQQPGFRCDVHVVERREPWEIGSESPVASAMSAGLTATKGEPPEFDAFSGTTDASFLVPAGVPCVICGPGDLANAHRENERIPLTELSTAARSYVLATVSFFELSFESRIHSS